MFVAHICLLHIYVYCTFAILESKLKLLLQKNDHLPSPQRCCLSSVQVKLRDWQKSFSSEPSWQSISLSHCHDLKMHLR